jgi:superfamily II DNA or RNA helicase
MELNFVITLSEHRFLGLVFSPYLIRKERSQEYFTIYERVTTTSLAKYESILSPEEVQLVKNIEEYNDQNLLKLFSKKKITSREFISGITPGLFQEQIRPYIEKRMAKCIDILSFNPVPIYHKLMQNNIYEKDRINEFDDEGTTVFNFIKTPEGLRYFLTIESNANELKLTGKEGMIVINEPCCVIIENKMFVFRDIDGKKLIPFFTKEFIQVPKSAERRFFEGFVRNAIKKYKVHSEGFTITDYESKPLPVISIDRDLKGRFLIMLKFIYGEKIIYFANQKTELKVNCEFIGNNVSFMRMQRDYSFENNCIASLLSMGLVNKDGPFFQPILKNEEANHSEYNIINWINLNRNIIHNSGFSISQDKLDRSYYLDGFAIKIDVSEKENDWFDINACVEFDGFQISFVKFYNNILNGDRVFELPDGRIMIIPEEWFESYRDILSFSKIEKESIILDKKHFPLLNQNIRGITGQFKKNLHDLIETECQPEEVPSEVKATLRHYQVEGYSWLYRLYKNGFGGCLADDMGLGKTLQTLTILKRVINENMSIRLVDEEKPRQTDDSQLSLFSSAAMIQKPSLKSSLIVVPTSLVHNWMNEASRFIPDLKVNVYLGTQRKDIKHIYKHSDVIITSYGILRNDLEEFIQLDFLYLVLDESQMVKNPGSKTYQSVIQIKAENRLALTGTPIENSLIDLWAQLNFLNPGLLGSIGFFRTEFQLPIEKNGDDNKRRTLKQLIAPFVMRRSKREVAAELPPVHEQIVFCNLDEQQEIYYEREKSKARNFVIEKMSKEGFGKSAVVILQTLTRLRQIANHPVLVDENYFGGSGKFDEISRNLESLHAEGHKALVFSSFVKHLELIAEFLKKKDIKYAWLSGETRDREREINKFINDSDRPIFLISLKAGGLGLNLTIADYVFILDPWWNPKAELQAISRAHRIGQDKHVFLYRFIARNTLEEKIIKLQERKSKLADAFIDENLQGMSEEQVMELFE